LRDGTPVVVRAIRPEDREALREGILHLSAETIYHRFLRAKRELTETELRYFTQLDFRNHIGLVLELPSPEGPRPFAVGRAVRTGHGLGSPGDTTAKSQADTGLPARQSAEVAFVVQDEYQGRGAGTILLGHLARIARALGYQTLEAEVLPDNQKMLEVFAHSGLALREKRSDGLVHVELDL
jgi:GNAT superfamily N-acetyltransferase